MKNQQQQILVRINNEIHQKQKSIPLNSIVDNGIKQLGIQVIEYKNIDKSQSKTIQPQFRQCDQTLETLHSKNSEMKKILSSNFSFFINEKQAMDNIKGYSLLQSMNSKIALRDSKHVSCGIYNIQEKAYSKFYEKQSHLIYSGKIFVYNNQQYIEQSANIWNKILSFKDKKIQIDDISKVKCLLQPIDHQFAERKIKIVINQNESYFIGASIEKKNANEFTQHYIWFCKIIYNKVQSIKNQLNFSKYEQLRQIFQQNDKNKSYFEKNQRLKLKLDIDPQKIKCKGTIYKKSKYLKTWQARYIVITQKQLYSFINTNENYTFLIKAEDVKYIWTRFDVFNGHLIIKIKHQLQQTQFGIPISNYFDNINDNWLLAFYRLLTITQSQHMTTK